MGMIYAKTITDFPAYAITPTGQVSSISRGKPLQPDAVGRVSLRRGGKTFNRAVGRMVLETFIGPCPAGHHCEYRDSQPTHTNLDNLKWGKEYRGRSRSKNRKLSDIDEAEIIQLLKGGKLTQFIIGRQKNVSQPTIARIKAAINDVPH